MSKLEAPESLLKFENPIDTVNGGDASAPSKKKLTNSELDEILNAILPPREFDSEGKTYLQYTSKSPATREDVIGLQETLDTRIKDRQARANGICPVREDLYTQAFDELIRQVTINTSVRGLLLLRVRDEIRMTIDAYKTLYDSSVTFGVRKQLQAEQGMREMEDQILDLEESKIDLENKVLELRNKVEVIEKREAEQSQLEETKRQEEIAFLQEQGRNLDQFLKSVSGSK
eukprot:g2773.t1